MMQEYKDLAIQAKNDSKCMHIRIFLFLSFFCI